jgi:glycosyltransferase involved in cell wall biosynthesis
MDVVLLTRNCEGWVRQCLDGIIEGINIDKLIVIDGDSTDGTLDIVRRYTSHIYSDGGRGLAYARLLGISHVNTELFAFIDSDVLLPKGWDDELVPFIKKDVGALESFVFEFDQKILRDEWYKTTFKGKSKSVIELTGKYARGYTGAVILKRRLLKGLLMPKISCHEDWVITQHILNQGYKWLKVSVPIKHLIHGGSRTNITAATIRRLSYISTPRYLGRISRILIGGLKYGLKFRDTDILWLRIEQAREMFDGYFHWYKYIHKEYPM